MTDDSMKLETFLALDTPAVADLVHTAGTKVCAFPFDGTRRWILLEKPTLCFADAIDSYINEVCRSMVDAFQLVFDHGIETILAPMVGPDLFHRGQTYLTMAARMLHLFGDGKVFRQFYEESDVRVHFYGDYFQYLNDSVCEPALQAFDEGVQATAQNQRHRLFWGIFGQDATRITAEFTVQFYERQGRLPTREEMIANYYGEPVGRGAVDLYLGFGAPAVFDIPLLATENTSCYWTASPSPYLDEVTLRNVLYDHLFARPGEPEYDTLSESDRADVRAFYRRTKNLVLGTGTKTKGGLWLPTLS